MHYLYTQSRFNPREYNLAASFATAHEDCPSEMIALAHLCALELKGIVGFVTSDDFGPLVIAADEATAIALS